MSEQQPKFHPWFHKFLVNFALWAFAAFAVLYGVKDISSSVENGVSFLPLAIMAGVLLILLGLFLIKVRFDLAAFRAIAPKELLWACVAGAVICLFKLLLEEISAEDLSSRHVISAVIFLCWGIALFRYYNDRPYLFKD